MVKEPTIDQLRREFAGRVKWAREVRGFTQQNIADLLGIAQDKYKWYETKRFMPHEHIARFCLACGVDPNWLMTGSGKAPAMPRPEAAPARKKKIRARTRVA